MNECSIKCLILLTLILLPVARQFLRRKRRHVALLELLSWKQKISEVFHDEEEDSIYAVGQRVYDDRGPSHLSKYFRWDTTEYLGPLISRILHLSRDLVLETDVVGSLLGFNMTYSGSEE